MWFNGCSMPECGGSMCLCKCKNGSLKLFAYGTHKNAKGTPETGWYDLMPEYEPVDAVRDITAWQPVTALDAILQAIGAGESKTPIDRAKIYTAYYRGMSLSA